MNKYIQHLILGLFLVIFSIGAVNAQYSVEGILISNNGDPIEGATITTMPESEEVTSNSEGYFKLTLVDAIKKLLIKYNGRTQEVDVNTSSKDVNLGDIVLESNHTPIAEIVLTDTEIEEADDEGGDDQSFSGILSASRDPFLNAASFNWSPAYFKYRGIGGTDLYVNGLSMRELESNYSYYSLIGGLNDAMRNSNSQMGPAQLEFDFGDMIGTQNVDITASSQRKQTKVSYASSNRSYRNRIMFIHSTGKMKNGWAFSVSGSKRWAQEGAVEGTDYNAYAYYLAAEKEIKNHKIGLVVLGSPSVRAKGSTSTQEAYDLAGTNYYNANWGYQEGKKRNAKVGNIHTPMMFLTDKWKVSESMFINTTFNYQIGRIGTTGLDWYKANDPRPDYYKNLPSYGNISEEAWKNGGNQLDWTRFYNVNRNSLLTVDNINGTDQSLTGLRSRYIIEEKRYDNRKLNFGTSIQKEINDNVTLNGGVNYQTYHGLNYKTVNDLLGGEFYVDIDKYGERDFAAGSDEIQIDLNNPNRILKVGDKFGYDYETFIKRGGAWAQLGVTSKRLDYYAAGKYSQTTYWRKGNYKNGKFPESSFGESEKQKFNNFAIKGGLTFKINGKNYLYTRALYQTNAPRMRDAYLSPRTRDHVVEGLKSNKVFSVEGGFVHNSSKTKLRATAFMIESKDNFIHRNAYIDKYRSYINLNYQGVDYKNLGVEIGFERQIVIGLTLKGGASIGDYIFNSRPELIVSYDNSAISEAPETTYLENYYIQSPQIAGNLGLSYRGKKYWTVYLDVNYFAKNYVGFNPIKHTYSATEDLEYQSKDFYTFLDQGKNDDVFMVNLSGRKSWKINDYFIYLNLGISNILNNQKLVNRSYEQLRYDTENLNKFPNKYGYALGINYYASVAFRF